MPRLSFSVLSLYPIPSNRPPLSLPTPVETSVLSLSVPPPPSLSRYFHSSRSSATRRSRSSLLFVNTGRQPGTTEPNFNEDCASESTASIGETLVSLCPLFLLPFRSNFRMKIIARFRGGSLSNAPFLSAVLLPSSRSCSSPFLLSF